MIDPTTAPSIRARAADSVLDHLAQAIELEDIEARVSELERAVKMGSLRRAKLRRALDPLRAVPANW